MKIIFLDIDGPMLPGRAYVLPENNKVMPRSFDKIAVHSVLALLTRAPAKLVISSTWATMGRETFSEVLTENGIDPAFLHDDWMTPRKMSSSRATEIKWWLEEHPEVTHWVALDDDPTVYSLRPNGIQCHFNDGLLTGHFDQAKAVLDIPGGLIWLPDLQIEEKSNDKQT